jgi:HK97 family phage major capsid protein
LPITNALLEDVAACSAYVDQRLSTFVKQRLDSQLLNGTGVAPLLMGLCNVVGVQSHVLGADPVPDGIAKGMDLVRVGGGYEPDAVVMHPNDWQAVRLLRTADGIYIWGSPADKGSASIWGLPVVVTSAITEGTALVGAFRQACQLFVRSDMAIAISDSHSDFFIKNKVMLRAEMRAAFAIYRPTAFCKVTGV